MNELIKNIESLAGEELARANEKYPLFHSEHEAESVIREEIKEALQEARLLEEELKHYEAFIHSNDEKMLNATIERIRRKAVLCASELVQVVAMCDKRAKSISYRADLEQMKSECVNELCKDYKCPEDCTNCPVAKLERLSK